MLKKIKAFAKINLFLDIVGKLPNGYHELKSVFQTISLYDEISITLTDKDVLVECDVNELVGEDNIVFKACNAFFEYSGFIGGAHVIIKKNIPIAAGLGGGSADAAATLLFLNEITGKNFPINELVSIAEKLGADVPFCLYGGTALVEGIGEKILPISSPELHFVLLKNGTKQSTGEMYKMLDSIETVKTGDLDKLINGLQSGNIKDISDNLYNAFSYCWDFENMTDVFKKYSPLNVFLSGSGPTTVALFKTQMEAVACFEDLKRKGCEVFCAKSCSRF